MNFPRLSLYKSLFLAFCTLPFFTPFPVGAQTKNYIEVSDISQGKQEKLPFTIIKSSLNADSPVIIQKADFVAPSKFKFLSTYPYRSKVNDEKANDEKANDEALKQFNAFFRRDSVIWMRINWRNNSEKEVRLFFSPTDSSDFTGFDKVDIYDKLGGLIAQHGHAQKYSREQRDHNYARLEFAAQSRGLLYVRVEEADKVYSLPRPILTDSIGLERIKNWHHRQYVRIVSFFSFFLALTIFVSAYCVIQFLSQKYKEWSLFYYGMYCFFVFLYILKFLETLSYFKLVFFKVSHYSYAIEPILLMLFLFYYYRFVEYFLELHQKSNSTKKIRLMLRSVQTIFIVYAILSFPIQLLWGNHLAQTIFNLMRYLIGGISLVLLFWILILKSDNQISNKLKWYILFGTFVLICAGIASIANPNQERFSSNIFTFYSIWMPIGLVIDYLCFLTGLALKSRLIIRQAEEREKAILAKEKEDEITVLKKSIEYVKSDIHDTQVNMRGAVKELIDNHKHNTSILEHEIVRKVLGSIHETIVLLDPPTCSLSKLEQQVNVYIQKINKTSKICYQVENKASVGFNSSKMSATTMIDLLRICSSCLDNVDKHASTHEKKASDIICKVTFLNDSSNFYIKIVDNGKGFIPDSIEKEYPFSTIHQRLEKYNGSLDYRESKLDHGAKFVIQVPIPVLFPSEVPKLVEKG